MRLAKNAKKSQILCWRSSEGVRCWMIESTTNNPRRNAMQKFITKFEKEIQGVMSGFDVNIGSAGKPN